MTYVELIVVLSIFATMTAIVLTNYNTFQAKVDVKILASDIALKIVEAQKDAMSGTMPPAPIQLFLNMSNWKPSYGVYFDPSDNNKIFISFADDNLNKFYPGGTPTCTVISQCTCEPSSGCLQVIGAPKNYTVSSIDGFKSGASSPITNPLSITFTRPGSNATFFDNDIDVTNSYDFIQITVSPSSSQNVKACIQVYPSGRVQIKCQ